MDSPGATVQGGRMSTSTNDNHTDSHTDSHTDTRTDTHIVSRHPAQPVDLARRNDHERRIRRAIDRRSFAVVSTVSAAGHPHAAGVVYANDGLDLYVSTHRTSRKARNVDATGRAAVVVPVRTLPVGPAFEVHFQATARLLDNDDPRVVELVERGVLSAITKHGELDEPASCIVEIRPTGRMHTYGIGVSALAVARDPMHVGAGMVDLRGGDFSDPRNRPAR
jgi:nitroimidazol reductase NimA-like FMN-containing flavoprotein (pyridoxamine 5'-phosphate oxidase superfamily)